MTTDPADDSDDPFAVVEALQIGARDTVPIRHAELEARRRGHADVHAEPVDSPQDNASPSLANDGPPAPAPAPAPAQHRPVETDAPEAYRQTEGVRRSTDGLPRQAEGVQRPTEAVDRTAVAAQRRSTRAVPRPAEAADQPTGVVEQSTGIVEQSTGIVEQPTGVVRAEGVVDPPSRSGYATVLLDDKLLASRPTVALSRQRKPPTPRAPLPVAVAAAALWAAAITYVPVAAVIGLARTLEGQGGLGGAAHAGLAAWLLGHAVPVGTSIGALGLPPLLLTMLICWRLNRAGVHVTRAVGARRSGSFGQALLVAAAIGLVYALLGSLAALGVDDRGTDVAPAHAALNFFVLGLFGALAGSLRCTDALSVLARRIPPLLRSGVRTGLVATLFLVAAGAAVAGLSVAVGGGQAADSISAFRTGVAGQAGVTLLSFGYGGNAAIWVAAYLLGPGFALGTGSAIRITEVTVGPLPTLPLLAGLPGGPLGVAGMVLLTVPVLAGLAAGWLFALRAVHGRELAAGPQRADPPWSQLLGGGLLAGPVAGIALGLLCQLSGGSLGDGRLATIGADPWQVGLVATAVIAASSAAGAATARAFGPARKR